jgi:hypothetical protein
MAIASKIDPIAIATNFLLAEKIGFRAELSSHAQGEARNLFFSQWNIGSNKKASRM